MNSFVDAHTPSESPEASSSESSTGGDWESGEFKTNELVVDNWPKQQRTVTFSKQKKLAISKSNTNKSNSITATIATSATTTTNTIPAKLSHQHQFKSKSNSIKILNSNNNNSNNNLSKANLKKMRWLSNMRSDPDFRETFINSVNIQTPAELCLRQSNDSLDVDYYSTICDTQLSLGSPYKSPSDKAALLKERTQKSRLRTRSLTKTAQQNSNRLTVKQQQHHNYERTQSFGTKPATAIKFQSKNRNSLSADDNLMCIDRCEPELIIAKPFESQSIGFNVTDTSDDSKTENASAKPICDNNNFQSNVQRNASISSSTYDDECTSPEIDEAAPRKSFYLHYQGHDTNSENLSSKSRQIDESASSSETMPKRPKSNDFDETFATATNTSTSTHCQANRTKNSKAKPDINFDKNQAKNSFQKPTTAPSVSTQPPKSKNQNQKNVLPLVHPSVADCDEVDSKITSSPSPSSSTMSTSSSFASTSSNSTCSSHSSFAPADTSGPKKVNTASAVASTESNSSARMVNPKRHRYPPFSFREIRNELRSIMRQNRNNKDEYNKH